MELEVANLTKPLRAIFVQSGLVQLVGESVFEAGIEDLKTGCLVAGAELLIARQHDVDLADAVLDPQRFPHLASLHGSIFDALIGDVPAELEGWIRKIAAAGPLPESKVVSQAIATIACKSDNVLHRELARFALFELACIQERLALRKAAVYLEALDGQRSAVEVLAEKDVDAACAIAESSDLLGLDDPVAMICKMVTLSLDGYVDSLREAVLEMSREMHVRLEQRKRVLEAAERVQPANAILILNRMPGEERLAPSQLRRLHPVLLGDLSDAAIYQRVRRLRDLVRKGRDPSSRSLLDIVVELMEERNA